MEGLGLGLMCICSLVGGARLGWNVDVLLLLVVLASPTWPIAAPAVTATDEVAHPREAVSAREIASEVA
jgi:hypothetical protein